MADPTVNHLGPLDNLRSAYSTLNDTVVRALLTQVGDSNHSAFAVSLLQYLRSMTTGHFAIICNLYYWEMYCNTINNERPS